MKFVSPEWLWGLLLAPLVFALFVLDEKGRRKRFERFAAKGLWRKLAPGILPGARLRKGALLTLSLVFALLALARPQWGAREEVQTLTGIDVMIALDLSSSMEAEDVVPTRLKKAKHEIRGLLERLRGDRVGLVGFAASGYLASPLTTDLEYLVETVQLLSPRLVQAQGTDISVGLEAAMRALDRGAENSSGRKEGQGSPSRVILLMTDGEDHEGGLAQMAAKLKDAGIKLYVIGIGTEQGAPVPIRDEAGQTIGFKKTRSGEAVVSRFHGQELSQLAAQAGGRYWPATLDESELSLLIQDLGELKPGQLAQHRYLVYQERFQYPLLIAVFLLLLELSVRLSLKPRSWARSPAGKTAVLCVLAASALLSPRAREARAAELDSRLDAYMENKKGVEAYRAGKINDARQHFGSAQALEPNSPELRYNQGLVQLQDGKTDEAVRDFKDAARGAMKEGDSRLLGRSYFNLGSALGKKGDAAGAIRSYLGAIDSARKSHDQALGEDARKNIELLVQNQRKKQEGDRKEKQEQKKDSGQGSPETGQDQQGKEGKNESHDQASQPKNGEKNGPESEQGKNSAEKPSDSGQKSDQERYADESQEKGFKSQKLSGDDAERVMQEIRNNEQALQARRQRQQNAYGNHVDSSNAEDW